MIRKCVGVGCTVYCAYQLGSYVYEQYTGAEGRGVEERPRPRHSHSNVSTQTDEWQDQLSAVESDGINVNQSKIISDNRSNLSVETIRKSESKKSLCAKRPFLSEIRSFKKKETLKLQAALEKGANENASAHLLCGNKMVHASRERDSEKSVPQRSGRERETRRSLLSEIQKFPKRKTSLTNVLRKHSDKHNVESNGTISKRRSLMPSNLLSDIRRAGDRLYPTKSTKVLKNTYSCPPVRKFEDKKGEPFPDSAKRKSKEHLALLDSIQKSGTGILKPKSKKRPSMPSVLLDDINKLRKTKSSGATFWPRRTSLIAEIKKSKSNTMQSTPSVKAVDSRPKKKMSLFEEMKLRKNKLRPVTSTRPPGNQQKEDNDPNGSFLSKNDLVAGQKRIKKKGSSKKKRGDSNIRSDGKSELQKLLARRQQGKSLKMTPKKIR